MEFLLVLNNNNWSNNYNFLHTEKKRTKPNLRKSTASSFSLSITCQGLFEASMQTEMHTHGIPTGKFKRYKQYLT